MNNYPLIAVCFLLGMALRRSGRLPDNAAARGATRQPH
jgi:hypothetical protein